MDEPDGVNYSSLEEDELDQLLSSFQIKEDPTPVQPTKKQTLNIEGVRVEFPYRAYESQLQMMKRIIIGVKERQNCLLESPTGTGKTAAILCSLLAWQRKCKELGRVYWDSEPSKEDNSCTCDFDIYPEARIIQTRDKRTQNVVLLRLPVEGDEPTIMATDDAPSPSKRKKVPIILIPEAERTMENLCGPCLKKHFYESSVPRIYYATRTHSQIAQVIKQLKVTEYSDVPMTILSSRQQTCINEEVLKQPPRSGLDHRCQTLRDGFHKNEKSGNDDYPTCQYFRGPGVSFKDSLPENGKAFDIEDIVRHGKVIEKCPFYGCRELHGRADIVFLPYNYLIIPPIRSSAMIRFPNSILVFDEAHNIEQICCDSLTIEIKVEFVNKIRIYFDSLLTNTTRPISTTLTCALNSLSARLRKLGNWLTIEGQRLQTARAFDGTDHGYKIFLEHDLVEVLKSLGLGPDDVRQLKEDFNALEDKNENESDVSSKSSVFIPPEQKNFLEELSSVLQIIYTKGMRRLRDFRASLEKKRTQEQIGLPYKDEYSFNIFCLNAGIAFEILKDSARTIIVTSGTLSPTISFASELETNFEQVLSAKHVVGSSQVWAAMMTTGITPNLNLELNASVLKGEVTILDELGEIILEICQRVPNGVLVFLPSYKTMELLKNRWRLQVHGESIMDRLQTCKHVFYEQSGQENMDSFKENMKLYQEKVLVDNGAILFAVFRGKVSEGVDFKDEQARAVVTIGIPFPYLGVQISLKRDYNDKRVRESPRGSYLSGREWYSAQAFRAMNQAFGRCLRHRHDWGALILIDSRLPVNQSKLSAWVVNFLRKERTGGDLLSSLDEFMQSKKIMDDTTQMLSNSQIPTQLISKDEFMTQDG